jgi:hypothetical protein
LVEASQHRDPLFQEGIADLEFSLNGEELYLLSPGLGAVIVFRLENSQITGLIPIPGGRATDIEVSKMGLLVLQEERLTILSPYPEEGLLAQFRFPSEVASVLPGEGKVHIALKGEGGVLRFRVPDGRTLAPLASSSSISSMVSRDDGSFVFLGRSGSLEGWVQTEESPAWSHSLGGSYDVLLNAPESGNVYAVDFDSKTLLTLDPRSGAELGRANIGESSGRPIVFSGLAK